MSELASIHEKLGRLLANAETLRSDIDGLKETLVKNNETSSEGRRRIYEAVEALDDRIVELEREVAPLSKTMREEVIPAVDDMRRLKAMGLGYLGLAGLAGSSLTGGFIALWDHLVNLIRSP